MSHESKVQKILWLIKPIDIL